jgi:TadE-like protein
MHRFFSSFPISSTQQRIRPRERTGVPVGELGQEMGTTIVEFSIIAALFFAVVLGTIDFSMAMFEMNGVNFGTRSQARSASNGEWGTDLSCNLTPESGPLDSDISDLMCATKRKTEVSADRVRVRVRFEDPDDPTRTDVKPELGKSLVLCTMTKMRSISGVFGPMVKDKVITSIARSRIERDLSVEWTTPESSVPKGPLAAEISSEASFSGSTWGFCEAKPIGNQDVGLRTDPLSSAFCRIDWLPVYGQVAAVPNLSGSDVARYVLEANVTNLSRDPWNSYEVEVRLPAGHTPAANENNMGRIVAEPPREDPTNSGFFFWKFRKVDKDPIISSSETIYGLPLADGDMSPGNGFALRIEVSPSAPSRSVPDSPDLGQSSIRIPPNASLLKTNPLYPFGNELFHACS